MLHHRCSPSEEISWEKSQEGDDGRADVMGEGHLSQKCFLNYELSGYSGLYLSDGGGKVILRENKSSTKQGKLMVSNEDDEGVSNGEHVESLQNRHVYLISYYLLGQIDLFHTGRYYGNVFPPCQSCCNEPEINNNKQGPLACQKNNMNP